ncbi:MAG: hypothetical protein H0W89_07200 [Candidatus Levybacteria bacterium]|nr:hypothetical protein [Candidatus Levybacteria bacterium]
MSIEDQGLEPRSEEQVISEAAQVLSVRARMQLQEEDQNWPGERVLNLELFKPEGGTTGNGITGAIEGKNRKILDAVYVNTKARTDETELFTFPGENELESTQVLRIPVEKSFYEERSKVLRVKREGQKDEIIITSASARLVTGKPLKK